MSDGKSLQSTQVWSTDDICMRMTVSIQPTVSSPRITLPVRVIRALVGTIFDH
jgi:hypothetical protein